MSALVYAGLLSVSALVSGLVAAYAWSERRSRGSVELARLAFAVTIWASCAALEGAASTLEGKLGWAGRAYLGGAMVAPLCLAFVHSYVGSRLTRRATAALFVIPVLTALLALTNDSHHWIYTRVSLVDTWAGAQGRFEHGPWYSVHTAYSYALIAVSLLWLWWSTRSAGAVRAIQARWVTVAFLVPLVGNLLYVLTPASVSGIDLAPVGFTFSGAALAVAIYRHRLMRLGPLARSLLFEQMDDAVVCLDSELAIVDFNAAAGAQLGLSHASLGRTIDDLASIGPPLGRLSRADADGETEIECGQGQWLRARCTRLTDAVGRSFGRLLVVQDVTRYHTAEAQRLEIERQMQHTQKLESLGVLAGGIAHDFNNLLTVVLGRADLALITSPHGSPTQLAVADIITASRRASDLCRQMLAYSGRGLFVIGDLSLNALLEEMVALIHASISKKAALTLDLGPDLPLVRGDATQLRQVIVNLITNASEALLEQPGTIEVTSRAGYISQDELHALTLGARLTAGQYVWLEVRDSGSGMPPDVIERIFEPFFTTKFTGRGLGLSAVLGIVRGHQGALAVTSRPGSGTRFRVVLPALSAAKPQPRPSPPSPLALPAATRRTVMLVDDERMVREVGTAMLERLGYDAVVAVDGRQALTIFAAAPAAIDCIILDLTMPGPNTDEVLRALRAVDPHIPVIVSSGYTEPEAGRIVDAVAFLQKPYELSKLRDLLDAALRESGAGRRRSVGRSPSGR